MPNLFPNKENINKPQLSTGIKFYCWMFIANNLCHITVIFEK